MSRISSGLLQHVGKRKIVPAYLHQEFPFFSDLVMCLIHISILLFLQREADIDLDFLAGEVFVERVDVTPSLSSLTRSLMRRNTAIRGCRTSSFKKVLAGFVGR